MEPVPGQSASMLPHSAGRRTKLGVVPIILIATVCVACGETMLAAGMRSLGNEHASGLTLFLGAISSKFVILGTCLMAVYFGLYSVALSRADISFVLPFTALSYLFVAILARCVLHEPVSPARWAGTMIIVLGVVVVGLGSKS